MDPIAEIVVSSDRAARYRVYGMSQSYFTRKLTLSRLQDYPLFMRRFVGGNHSRAMLMPGAMPLVMTPSGDFMWDTTAMIHHWSSTF